MRTDTSKNNKVNLYIYKKSDLYIYGVPHRPARSRYSGKQNKNNFNFLLIILIIPSLLLLLHLHSLCCPRLAADDHRHLCHHQPPHTTLTNYNIIPKHEFMQMFFVLFCFNKYLNSKRAVQKPDYYIDVYLSVFILKIYTLANALILVIKF